MKAFLRNFLATVLGVLAAVFLLALIASTAILHEERPELADGSVLTVDLGMAVSDRGRAPSPQEVVLSGAEDPLELRAVRAALLEAAADERIAGLFLRGDAALGTASLEALREGVAAFAAAGKPAVAFLDQPAEAELYLASACDEVFVPPLSLVEFNGLAFSSMFYKGLLDRLGIGVQVTRVGKYKSAVEPFLLDEMSPANREQLQKLADDLEAVVLERLAEGRGTTADALREVLRTRGLLSPEEAVAAGLVDGVKAFDEVLALWAERLGAEAEELDQIGLEDYLALVELEAIGDDALYETEGVVAVVYAEGDIVDGDTQDGVGGDTVARALRRARLDEEVDAVVLRVNSPGGSAFASETILREVRLTRAAKPVVVSMGDLAASGGYWISCLADEIWARPGTITGSIGVFGMFPHAGGLLAEVGVSPQTVKTGEFADMDTMWRPKSEAELARFQEEVDGIYEAFLDRVVEGRGLDREAVHEIAQGRVWSGRAALELGLVDRLGGLHDAVAAAAQRAGLGAGYEVRWPEEAGGFLEQLLAGMAPSDPPLSRASALLRSAAELERVAAARGVQARMPFLLLQD
jgi:protease-4